MLCCNVLALDLLCIYFDATMRPRHVFQSNALNIDEFKFAQKTSRIFLCLFVIYSYDKPSCAIIILKEFQNRYVLILPPSSSNDDNDRCCDTVARILPLRTDSVKNKERNRAIYYEWFQVSSGR